MALGIKPPKALTFEGIKYNITQNSLGSGSQGEVFLAKRSDNPSQQAVVKSIPNDTDILKRTQYLVDCGIGYDLPFLSAPLAIVQGGRKKQHFYLSTFADGVDLENAVARSLPERLMTAYLAVSLWCEMEARHFIHGDISLNNMLIGPDGTAYLIDVDNYVGADCSVPRPILYGQHPVMAPELKQAEQNNKLPPISLMTDRYAWCVDLSFLLLQRHPASWTTGGPIVFDKAMAQGHWPERDRSKTPDLPIQILNSDLQNLFDQGFSLSPLQRPDAETWRKILGDALNRIYVHDCGTAFVHETGRHRCPGCGVKIPALVAIDQPQPSTNAPTITLEHIQSGQKVSFPLPEGQFIFLGRDNLPNASGCVSTRHLQIYRQNQTLYVSSLGRNGTGIELATQLGQYRLNEMQDTITNSRLSDAILLLGDTKYKMTFS